MTVTVVTPDAASEDRTLELDARRLEDEVEEEEDSSSWDVTKDTMAAAMMAEKWKARIFGKRLTRVVELVSFKK